MAEKRNYWLVKSEPDVFSIDDLFAAPGKSTCWDGVRNYTARNMLRDELKNGDGVLYYHSRTDPPGIAGTAEVVREGYPDHTQFDPKNSHFDAKADPENPRWFMVDIRALEKFPRHVPLEEIKASSKLAEMAVVQRGQRLSVQRVTAAEWREVLRMGKSEKR